MKICETCGKEIEQSEAYENNGVIQCKECTLKSLNSETANTETKVSKDDINAIKALILESSNPLIKVMKLLVVIGFFIVILIALFALAISVSYSFRSAGYAFLYFIATILADCLSVGMLIVILNYFEDISEIKDTLKKK